MKHVSILPLYESTMTSIDSTHQILMRVNDFMNYQGKSPAYAIDVVGLEKTIKLNDGLFDIHVTKTLEQVQKTDVIVIPLLCGNFSSAIMRNKRYTEWVIKQYHNQAEIVCLCVGSFFLASTGLLQYKKCAVHWAARNEFATMFPDVRIVDGKIITEENGIYTCGGGYSYLNLLLYMIEKHVDKETSILASKMFEIDIERKSQNPFMIFMGQKRHDDEAVLKAQAFIENNPNGSFTVEELCQKLNIGRRTFERRFKRCTENSVVEYIQRVKVEFAKKHLEQGRKTIAEISYETGYNDLDAFRRVFKKFTDLSPVNYRKRFAS